MSDGDRRKDLSQETHNFATDTDIQSLKAEVARLSAEISTIKADRDKQLKWGIAALGSAVLGMATWIWNNVLFHAGK